MGIEQAQNIGSRSKILSLPTLSPSDVMQQIKGYTSKVLREEFAELSKMPSLWTRSYFVSTDGNVCRKSKEKILNREYYIRK